MQQSTSNQIKSNLFATKKEHNATQKKQSRYVTWSCYSWHYLYTTFFD